MIPPSAHPNLQVLSWTIWIQLGTWGFNWAKSLFQSLRIRSHILRSPGCNELSSQFVQGSTWLLIHLQVERNDVASCSAHHIARCFLADDVAGGRWWKYVPLPGENSISRSSIWPIIQYAPVMSHATWHVDPYCKWQKFEDEKTHTQHRYQISQAEIGQVRENSPGKLYGSTNLNHRVATPSLHLAQFWSLQDGAPPVMLVGLQSH